MRTTLHTAGRRVFGLTGVWALVALLPACSEVGSDVSTGSADAAMASTPRSDAIAPSDASPTADAASGPDAAAPTDAGAPADAAVSPPDAGAPTDAAVSPPPGLRVLFIGNSYTFADDLEQRYAEVRAADAEAREVIVERIASPGYRLEQHLADLQTPGSATATRWASHCGGEAPWTYVVLQEQSQIPGFPPDEPAAVASRAAAVALGERARACGAEPVLFETWGRRDGDADNPGLFPDYPTMQDRLDEGFEAMAAAGGLRRARVGAAFRALHARPDFDFGRLYVADGSHPSALGTWLAALVIAGVTPSRDATRPTSGPPGAEPTVVRLLEAVAGEVTAER
jgi:hypothetical protein